RNQLPVEVELAAGIGPAPIVDDVVLNIDPRRRHEPCHRPAETEHVDADGIFRRQRWSPRDQHADARRDSTKQRKSAFPHSHSSPPVFAHHRIIILPFRVCRNTYLSTTASSFAFRCADGALTSSSKLSPPLIWIEGADRARNALRVWPEICLVDIAL